MKDYKAVVFLFILTLISSCVSQQEADEMLGTRSAADTSGAGSGAGVGSGIIDPKILKLVDATNNPIDGVYLNVGVPLVIRAATFDFNDQFIEYAPVSWSIIGSTVTNANFPASNLIVDPMDASKATLTPTTVGTLAIDGVYTGTDNTVVVGSHRTGTIYATSSQTVDSLAIVAGDNQSIIVDTNLSTDIKVRALDQFAQPIAGALLEIDVVQGGGAIVGANQVVTDAAGDAIFSAKTGTVIGAGINIYRVRSVPLPAIFVYITATGLPGVQHHLAITTQPGLANQTTSFGTQPVVEVQDVFNNKLTVAGNMVMSKIAGAGLLSGTSTLAFTNGLATYTNLSWDTQENNVQLRASYNGLTIDSSLFNVGQSIPGSCVATNAQFRTQEGGCKDLVSGIVWSSLSSGTMIWDDAIWDPVTNVGSVAADVNDFGRTNDYDEGVPFTTTDGSIVSYCKSLNEGGYNDWRMPTFAEMQDVSSRSGKDYLRTVANSFYHSGSSSTTALQTYSVNIVTGVLLLATKATARNVFCVRSGTRSATAPTKIVVVSGPTNYSRNVANTTSLVVQIQNASNNNVHLGGITLTLTSSIGNVTVGSTAVTTIKGTATFTNVTLDTAGASTLTISYNGGGLYSLTAATRNVTVNPYKQYCLINDAFTSTADGGCKDLGTGLIWAAVSTVTMNWYNAVWDSLKTGSPVQDADDNGRTNDYGEDCTPTTSCDDNANGASQVAAYCKNLNEGGCTDWRLPSLAELTTLLNNTNYLRLPDSSLGWVWSGDVDTTVRKMIFHLLTGAISDATAVSSYYTMCVRGGFGAAASINVIAQPRFIKPLVTDYPLLSIQLKDSLGNNMTAEKTITISSGTLTIGGTTTFTTDKMGYGTTNAFTINNVAGTHTITLSTPGFPSTNITVTTRTTAGKSNCYPETVRFISQNGGCHDVVTGLVWGAPTTTARTWYQAIWDSALGGNVAPDGDDGAEVNDYDNAAGANPDSSTVNYCHDLVEGGFTNWRVPTSSELMDLLLNASANIILPKPINSYFHTSTTTGNDFVAIHAYTWATANGGKGVNYYTMCVRNN